MLRLLSIVIVLSLLVFRANGQDSGRGSRFSEVLDKMERSRSSVATAIFTVHEIDISSYEVSVGEKTETVRRVTKRRWNVYADFSREAFLLSAQGDAVLPGMGAVGALSYLIRGPTAFNINASGEFAETRVILIPFTNPLIYGLGFCAEIGKFQSFPEVASNVRSWESSGVTLQNQRTGPIEKFGLPLWGTEKFQMKLEIDTSRGYTPVRLERWITTDKPNVRAEMDWLMKDGVWLPSSVSYVCGDDKYLLRQFEWLMVNEPLPEGFFLPENISNVITTKNPTAFLVDGVADDN